MKNWFKGLLSGKKNVQGNEEFPIVWDSSQISIYQFLLPYKLADQLPETAQKLPDEPQDDGQLKWVAGAFDGVINHHSSSLPDAEQINQILRLFTRISEGAKKQDVKQLYSLIKEGKTLNLIDKVIEEFLKLDINFHNLYLFFYWLLLNTPDREVVKFSISMLGSYTAKQTELFQLLGMHEEFTLYSAVALSNTIGDHQEKENALLCLAKKVHGWGRISLVDRLAREPSDEVKGWLLREGYKNNIMYEYLAYTCAVAGELRVALENEGADTALMLGASEIIESLIMGGPAEDMRNYEEGAGVCLNYLIQLQKQPVSNLRVLKTLLTLRDFVVDDLDETYPNWEESIKIAIINKINGLTKHEYWLPLIEKELCTNDNANFWVAADVYTGLGFDAWQARFNYQKNNNTDQWFYLMKTDDLNRVQQAIGLAKEQNDFSAIATGPALEMGFGTEFKTHDVLGFILQALPRFPGVGEDLVFIGLNSPVIRNRNAALEVMKNWSRELWSDKIKAELQRLMKIEPDENVKKRITTLLS